MLLIFLCGWEEKVPRLTLSDRKSLFTLFSNSKKVSNKLNFYEKLDVLENTLNNWKRPKLILLGKIDIVKVVIKLLLQSDNGLLVSEMHKKKKIGGHQLRFRDKTTLISRNWRSK